MIAEDHTDIQATLRDAAHDIVDVVRAGAGDTVDKIIAIVEPARAEISAQKQTIETALQGTRQIRQAVASDVAEAAKDGRIDKADAAEEISEVIEAWPR